MIEAIVMIGWTFIGIVSLILIDIGTNDGTFLSFFVNNCQTIGIDPTIKKFKKL